MPLRSEERGAHVLYLVYPFYLVYLVCALFVFTAGVGLSAQTADRGRTQEQARRVNDRIRVLQEEADRLAGQARTLIGDLRTLEIQRELHVEQVQTARAAVASGQEAINDTALRLSELEQQRIAQLPDLKTQLVDIYKRGRAGYAKLLFGASGAREFGRATRAVAALMHINEGRIVEHRLVLDELRQERATLEANLGTLQARESEAQEAQAAAERALASRTALIAKIDASRDLNAQFAGELQVAAERLQQQMADLGAGRAVESVALPLAPFRGALEWPASGAIAVRFGQRSGRFGEAAVRNGIEIRASEGAPVRAIHPGTVSFADTFAGFAKLVIVDHGASTSSLYGYLENVSVARGDTVDAGSELGHVGLAPAGPPALYFEVRIDGRSVDPVQWLKPR